jgi:hypothetical protein
MLHRRTLLWGSGLAVLIWACSDAERITSGPRLGAPESLRANIGGFGCGVAYDAITQTDETELSPFAVEAVTDTSHICEQWTGNDYNAEITQTGTSEPVSDYSEDVGTVIYQTGTTSAYDKSAQQMEGPGGVGATSFEFVAATSDEQQASYNEPYYAVVQDPDPVHCSNPPCAIQNISVGASGAARDGNTSLPNALPSIRRAFLKSLLNGKTEIAPSLEGFRQFRSVAASGEEETISIDPVTELIRRQEIKTAKGSVRADLNWSLINGKYVREVMDVTGDDIVAGKHISSKTRITLRNVQWDPTAIR